MPKIIINPEVFNDQRDAKAVAWNEALRIWMEANKFIPKFIVTEKQQEFFQDTAYSQDELMLKRTIIARIITHDTSVADVTEPERAECVRLLEDILKKYKGDDLQTVSELLQALPKAGDYGEPEAGTESPDAEELEEPDTEDLESPRAPEQQDNETSE
jgi:hypothetical protein